MLLETVKVCSTRAAEWPAEFSFVLMASLTGLTKVLMELGRMQEASEFMPETCAMHAAWEREGHPGCPGPV